MLMQKGRGEAVHFLKNSRGPTPLSIDMAGEFIHLAVTSGAAPERLYLIGADGCVAYHGGAGPHFFDLDAWDQAIAAEEGEL